MKLKAVLEDELDGVNFGAQLRIGPKEIVRSRTMKVDENDMPSEKRMQSIVRDTLPRVTQNVKDKKG